MTRTEAVETIAIHYARERFHAPGFVPMKFRNALDVLTDGHGVADAADADCAVETAEQAPAGASDWTDADVRECAAQMMVAYSDHTIAMARAVVADYEADRAILIYARAALAFTSERTADLRAAITALETERDTTPRRPDPSAEDVGQPTTQAAGGEWSYDDIDRAKQIIYGAEGATWAAIAARGVLAFASERTAGLRAEALRLLHAGVEKDAEIAGLRDSNNYCRAVADKAQRENDHMRARIAELQASLADRGSAEPSLEDLKVMADAVHKTYYNHSGSLGTSWLAAAGTAYRIARERRPAAPVPAVPTELLARLPDIEKTLDSAVADNYIYALAPSEARALRDLLSILRNAPAAPILDALRERAKNLLAEIPRPEAMESFAKGDINLAIEFMPSLSRAVQFIRELAAL